MRSALAARLKYASVRIRFKGADDGAGMIDSLPGWCEGGVKDRDLRWVNGYHADKGIARASPGIQSIVVWR